VEFIVDNYSLPAGRQAHTLVWGSKPKNSTNPPPHKKAHPRRKSGKDGLAD